MTMVSEPLADAGDMLVAHMMLATHTMFRREFGLMPGLVRAVAAGDKQRAALVADHIALMSGVLNRHYAGEDEYVWPLLRQRCPEECASLADIMTDQHHAVYACLLLVAQAAESWRDSASADTRDALAGAVHRLTQATNEHLALVEEHVVPLIEKHLTEAEYAVLALRQAAYIPPAKLPAVFGMVMYQGDPAAIDIIVAEMPVEVQPVIKDLAVKAYVTYARELYGIAAPPRVTG
jgi:hemerythrin-like domain-containing protein